VCIIMYRIFMLGLLIWIASTVVIRLIGQRLLHPDQIAQPVLLYAISLVLMILLVRGIALWQKIERGDWIRVAGWLALPTLLLDPFSCIFFNRLFPNMDPAVAGIFGGWMLISCCGAVLGGLLIQGATPVHGPKDAGVSLSRSER
jgi:hypothetical protein